MLRSLVLILLLLNLAFFSWTQGWLNSLTGLRPNQQQEPHRLKLQHHADHIEVISPEIIASAQSASEALAVAIATAASASSEVTSASTPASVPSSAEAANTACLTAGPFGTMEINLVTAALRDVLPPDAWRAEEVTLEGLWFVYMGPYPDRALFNRKQAELKAIREISFSEVRTPTSLANGFVLGRYPQPEAAQAALEQMKTRGLRSARVVTIRPRIQAQNIVIPQATQSWQATLPGIRLPQGKRFTACTLTTEAAADSEAQGTR